MKNEKVEKNAKQYMKHKFRKNAVIFIMQINLILNTTKIVDKMGK